MLWPMSKSPPSAVVDERAVSLFRNGRNQAVRIPREFELVGTQAVMRKEGDSLVITPIKSSPLLALLAGWQPLAEGVPEVSDSPPQDRKVF